MQKAIYRYKYRDPLVITFIVIMININELIPKI